MSFPVDHSRCGRYVDVEHLIFPLAVHHGFVGHNPDARQSLCCGPSWHYPGIPPSQIPVGVDLIRDGDQQRGEPVKFDGIKNQARPFSMPVAC